MATDYARSVQAPTGRMQARDLRAGDTVLIRKYDALDRTPETILDVKRDGQDVILFFAGWHHRTSPTMTVALAAEEN